MSHQSHQVDEETPLLQPEAQHKIKTPLPWRQFSIILFLQLTEPVTAQAIAPFAPQVNFEFVFYEFLTTHEPYFFSQLIRDVGVTHGDESRVGYFVGIMVSAQCLLSIAFF
jgi:hypothetical protein